MIQRVSALWVRLKANRLAYTFSVLLTLTAGILIGTVISSGVKGQDKKSSSSEVAPLTCRHRRFFPTSCSQKQTTRA